MIPTIDTPETPTGVFMPELIRPPAASYAQTLVLFEGATRDEAVMRCLLLDVVSKFIHDHARSGYLAMKAPEAIFYEDVWRTVDDDFIDLPPHELKACIGRATLIMRHDLARPFIWDSFEPDEPHEPEPASV